eukprot:3148646-Alexandrium_andersonii.AAC.1
MFVGVHKLALHRARDMMPASVPGWGNPPPLHCCLNPDLRNARDCAQGLDNSVCIVRCGLSSQAV